MQLTRRQIIATATAASLGIVAVAGYSVASAHHEVAVMADGRTTVVAGFYQDVDQVIEAGGIQLGEHDQVEPELGTPLDGVHAVQVLRANPVTVHTESGTQTEWTTASSLDQAYEYLTETGTVDSFGVSRGYLRTELPLANGTRQVTVLVDGEPHTVEATGSESAAQLVAAAGVELSPLDSVFVVPGENELTVEVTTETRAVTNRSEEIPYETEYVDDPDLLEGNETVIDEGAVGTRIFQVYLRSVGGVAQPEHILSEEVAAQPVNRVIAVGTKKPAPAVVSASGSGSDVSGVQISDADAWAAIAQCESGGNPSMNSGNGYYGMYQFSLPTWQSVGGVGLPSDASAAEQTQRAQILQQRSGWGQWPACSARLGLR